jgi:hypothetical protein
MTVWTSRPLHGRHVYDLGTPGVDEIASNALLRVGQIFPEKTGFMIAIQDQVISTSSYKKHMFKDPNITSDICRKYREKKKKKLFNI